MRWRLAMAATIAIVTFLGSGSPCPAQAPIAMGTRLELFVDTYLIDTMSNTSLVLHEPERQEVVLTFTNSWEGPASAYPTVLYDEVLGQYRMYYRGGGEASPTEVTWEVACIAESTDGKTWTKPILNLWAYPPKTGTDKQNNIVWIGAKKSGCEGHNFAPFIDRKPGVPSSQRYKAVGSMKGPNGERWLAGLYSSNGTNWQYITTNPIITDGAFDSQNVAFYDPNLGKYVCYLRDGRTVDGVTYRSIRRATSDDFITWTTPVFLEFGGAPWDQLYTNAIAPYARATQIYLGFPMRHVNYRATVGNPPVAVDALSDAVMISSHDGLNFNRQFMDALIRPGMDSNNWGKGHGDQTPAWGLLQLVPEELSVYWLENYVSGAPRVRRGTVRTDGFASVNAPSQGGEFRTKPITFTGKYLTLNYSTSAVGSVKVEIQDANGVPKAGFSLADCAEIYGDELERTVLWGGVSDLSALVGQTVRLRFVMNDADLYSIRFKP